METRFNLISAPPWEASEIRGSFPLNSCDRSRVSEKRVENISIRELFARTFLIYLFSGNTCDEDEKISIIALL